jgi:hypothetical protein
VSRATSPWNYKIFAFESETEQTPFDSCDPIMRIPDALPPLGVRGNDGLSLLGPFPFWVLSVFNPC